MAFFDPERYTIPDRLVVYFPMEGWRVRNQDSGSRHHIMITAYSEESFLLTINPLRINIYTHLTNDIAERNCHSEAPY